MTKYQLAKGYGPGRYTLGEGLELKARDNELTDRQAAPYVKFGILKEQKRPKRKSRKGKKRGKS